jgi:hypothetical protein
MDKIITGEHHIISSKKERKNVTAAEHHIINRKE